MEKSVKEIFVERLKDLMTEKSLSIQQLSLATKLPRTTINNWILGKVRPQIEALCVLADFFGVTIDYLLGREN